MLTNANQNAFITIDLIKEFLLIKALVLIEYFFSFFFRHLTGYQMTFLLINQRNQHDTH